MRKIILVLAVLALASPAMATVTITCTPGTGSGEVTVSFVNTSGRVRAFALDIAVDNGAFIDSVDEESFNADYSIYPGSIDINSETGVVDANGSPVCGSGYPGTEPGIGSASMTIEMGSLYVGEGNAPGQDDDLLTFVVDCNGAADCNVTVALNTIRGGVVMEDHSTPTPGLVGCKAVCAEPPCFPDTYSTYGDWVTLGEPACWCAAYHCDGDADGLTETLSKYRIYGDDVALVAANWKKKIDDVTLDPCADIDHKSETLSKYRVYGDDIAIIASNWKKKDADLPGDCPRTE